MNDDDTIRARRLPDGTLVQVLPDGSTRPLVGTTDWARVLAMTDDEIEANAAADPDNPPLSPADLARLRPAAGPREIRLRLRLTQEEFAARFGVPLELVRDWEQGVRQPDAAARTLLRVIDRDPDAVIRALKA